MSLSGLRALFSFQTLLTGLLGVAVWSMFYDWRTGLALVLLLYIHEVGHILVARWRRVPVIAPPIILPGLGAFVLISPTPGIWNDILISLGGPVIGGLASFVIGLAGKQLGLPWLAWVGLWGLILNLLNLLPMLPLDGGRVTSRAGWMALIGGALIGGLLAFQLHLEFFLILVAFATYRHLDKDQPKVRWFEGALALVLLAATGGGLFLLVRLLGPTYPPAMQPIPALRPLQIAALLLIGWFLIGGLLHNLAKRIWKQMGARHILRLLFLTPQYILMGMPGLTLTMVALLAKVWGRPTLSFVERQVLRLAPKRTRACAETIWAIYESLYRSGDPALHDWCTQVMPKVAAINFEAYVLATTSLLEKIDEAGAIALIRQEAHRAQGDLERFPPTHLNNLAWLFLKAGEPDRARPFAEAAYTREPESGPILDTLGQVYLALGEYAAAEPLLRGAIARIKNLGARTGLARALAGQGRLDEAIAAAQEALKSAGETWSLKDISRAEVEGWIVEWQAQSHPTAEGAD